MRGRFVWPEGRPGSGLQRALGPWTNHLSSRITFLQPLRRRDGTNEWPERLPSRRDLVGVSGEAGAQQGTPWPASRAQEGRFGDSYWAGRGSHTCFQRRAAAGSTRKGGKTEGRGRTPAPAPRLALPCPPLARPSPAQPARRAGHTRRRPAASASRAPRCSARRPCPAPPSVPTARPALPATVTLPRARSRERA